MGWSKLENKGPVLEPNSAGQSNRRWSCPRTWHHFSNVWVVVDCRTRLEDDRGELRRLFAQIPTYELSLQHNNRVLTSRLLLPCFRLRTQVLAPRSCRPPAAPQVSRRQSTPTLTPTLSGNTTFSLLIMVFPGGSSVPD